VFLVLREPGTEPSGEETGKGTNFISQFNPFATKPKPPAENPPAETTPDELPVETEKLKFTKVSSMPIAGFAVFTKERLKDVPAIIPAITEETPYDFGSATIKNGSTGEAVKEVQRFLNKTLNLSLELDGTLNAETIAAIKKWQGDHGLVTDGVVGAKTKVLMYSSVNQNMGTSNPTSPPTEFMSALRYVDKATGNIYQTFADKIEERKFTTTIIPRVHEAYFGNHGGSVIMRYLKADARTIETFVGSLPKEVLGGDTTGNNEIKGSFLPSNVKDVSLSPDTLKVFYLFESGENIIGTILNLTTNQKTQIFDSPFTEWLPEWPNQNTITLSTKPSFGVPGYIYSMNSAGKNFSKTLGDINGLTALTSPDGKLILFSNNNLSLNVYHTDTRNSDTLGIKTLSEKCVWGKMSDAIYCAVPKLIGVGAFPDSWYQGEVSFSDQIWKINVKNGNGALLLDPVAVRGGEEIDGMRLALDENENYLFFMNKKNSFLWELELK